MAYRHYPFEDASISLLRQVFERGAAIDGYDSSKWRRDKCGNIINFDKHGEEGDYGWEIDHIKPTSRGGSDDLSNLQPLWWKNNRRKGDTYPWYC